MKGTLLFDLDNTLLGNDVNVFLPEYMRDFARFVSGSVDPQQFLAAMQRGTRAMTHNRQPDCTLKETFEAVFYSDLRVDPVEFSRLAARFYAEVFPTLKRLTRPIPGAAALVEKAFDLGYRIAITTNPLFPLAAQLHRLDWAGLPADRYPFELVGSYEKFHYAKPDPAFYAETLAYMGWPAGRVVVVGDDLVRDIAAGAELGLSTFWIPADGAQSANAAPLATAAGSQADIIPWLEADTAADRAPDYNQAAALTAILRSTPAALDGLCRDLDAAAWSRSPGPHAWGLTEIACHLRDVEIEVNLPRVQKFLETTNPFLPGQDTDAWAAERDYADQDGRLALGRFSRARLELVKRLEALAPVDWQLPARHAIFGPTHLQELVGIMTAHDRLHVQQVLSVLRDTPI